MSGTGNRWTPVAIGGVLAAGCAGVVRRMEHEYGSAGTLRPATVTAMYAAYTGSTAAVVWSVRRHVWPLPLPRSGARNLGFGVAGVGAGMVLAGMSRFDSAGQINATETGRLHTGGVYQWSRNPQYLGNSLLVSGAAIAGRSGFGGALAAGVWLVYRRWIRVEEQHLSDEFGDEYAAYRRRVRRWFGRRSDDSSSARVPVTPSSYRGQ